MAKAPEKFIPLIPRMSEAAHNGLFRAIATMMKRAIAEEVAPLKREIETLKTELAITKATEQRRTLLIAEMKSRNAGLPQAQPQALD